MTEDVIAERAVVRSPMMEITSGRKKERQEKDGEHIDAVFPKEIYDQIMKVVRERHFTTRSAFMRQAVMLYLKLMLYTEPDDTLMIVTKTKEIRWQAPLAFIAD